MINRIESQYLRKISIVLFGPGTGQNASMLLGHLSRFENLDITLLTPYYGLGDEVKNRITIVEYFHKITLFKRILMVYSMVTLKGRDMLYIMGSSNIIELIPAMILIRRRGTIFNIWGDTIPTKLEKKTISSRIYGVILGYCDSIFCNWDSTWNILVKNAPQLAKKAKVLNWGISDEFIFKKPIVTRYTDDYLENLPKDKVIFLNMRSIDYYNEISLILDAIVKIKNLHPDCYEKLYFIFWHGNNVIPEIFDSITKHVSEFSLGEAVKCVKHPFLPVSDIRHIVEKSHAVVNFVNRDCLSFSVMEALFLNKRLLLSDIDAYRLFISKYNLKIKLVSLSADDFAKELVSVIQDNVNFIDSGDVSGEKLVTESFLMSSCIKAINAEILKVSSK